MCDEEAYIEWRAEKSFCKWVNEHESRLEAQKELKSKAIRLIKDLIDNSVNGREASVMARIKASLYKNANNGMLFHHDHLVRQWDEGTKRLSDVYNKLSKLYF